MTDETNAPAAVEPPALKSTDTRVAPAIVEPKPKAPDPKPKVEPAKVESAPDGEVHAPVADASSKEQRLPRWMKERLERERQVTEARTRAAVEKEFQERQPAAQPKPAVAAAEVPKTLMDFNFDQAAFTDYLVEQKLQKREAATKAQTQAEEQAKATESFKARVDDFEHRAGDGSWEDIVQSPLNTDPKFKSLTEMFMGDDHDLDIAHYLATNLADAERIHALPKLQQVREIAKLAEKFDAPADVAPTPTIPPKKTTSAPPPPKTVSGAGKPPVDINDPGLSPAERIRLWRRRS